MLNYFVLKICICLHYKDLFKEKYLEWKASGILTLLFDGFFKINLFIYLSGKHVCNMSFKLKISKKIFQLKFCVIIQEIELRKSFKCKKCVRCIHYLKKNSYKRIFDRNIKYIPVNFSVVFLVIFYANIILSITLCFLF